MRSTSRLVVTVVSDLRVYAVNIKPERAMNLYPVTARAKLHDNPLYFFPR
jgi:hypothetical protein